MGDGMETSEEAECSVQLQLNSLPNEIFLKIWKYLGKRNRRRSRAVCLRWSAFFRYLNERAHPFDSLTVSVKDGKFVVCGSSSMAYESKRTLEVSTLSDLRRALLLIAFRHRRSVLTIASNTATAEVLSVISAQRWNIKTIVFEGDLIGCDDKLLGLFLATINRNSSFRRSPESIFFKDAIVSDGLLTDNLIASLPKSVREFVVDLNPNSMSKLRSTELTDGSLLRLMQGSLVLLPLSRHFTVDGIEKALRKFFESSEQRGASRRYPITLQVFLCNGYGISAEAVAQLDIDDHVKSLHFDRPLNDLRYFEREPRISGVLFESRRDYVQAFIEFLDEKNSNNYANQLLIHKNSFDVTE